MSDTKNENNVNMRGEQSEKKTRKSNKNENTHRMEMAF